MKLNQFESDVLLMMLEGQSPILKELLKHYKILKVKNREYTGAGFYVDFYYDKEVEPLKGEPNFEIGDISADIVGLKNGAGLLLFIREGKIKFLEGYSYNENWPDEIKNYKLSYDGKSGRDFEKLCNKLDKLIN